MDSILFKAVLLIQNSKFKNTFDHVFKEYKKNY